MSTNYEEPISIKETINKIDKAEFLLPAIQRRFVWKENRICNLFDSILNEYPINTFLSWQVEDNNIKNDYKFYEFLKSYHEKNSTENPLKPTDSCSDNFRAIMDGQQRLTSLYIGLRGSFSSKEYRKKRKNDSSYIEKKLYIPLELIESEKWERNTETHNPNIKNYNFLFLSENEYRSKKIKRENFWFPEIFWFPLEEILKFEEVYEESQIKEKIIQPYLEKHALKGNLFAEDTLYKLYNVIRIKKTIHFFNEKKQDPDLILNSFIRVNTGGIDLSYAQLMESIIISHWEGNFRQEQYNLMKEIQELGFLYDEKSIQLLKNLILRVSLMLTETDIKLNVQNFKAKQVERIRDEWKSIKECLKETFIFIKEIGVNNESLNANVIIPISYYLYKKKIKENEPLYKTINNSVKNKEEKKEISRFLYISLVKKEILKSNGLDSFLISIRKTLDENIEKTNFFPIDEIIERYKETKRDFSFNENNLEELLNLEYGDKRCKPLLHLIFIEKDPNVSFEIDHVHPKNSFSDKNLIGYDFLKENEELLNFYRDKKHWNSLANLQLLDKYQNSSKGDKPLKKWIEEESHSLSEEYIDIDLSFEKFPEFYSKRREKLKERLKKKIPIKN